MAHRDPTSPPEGDLIQPHEMKEALQTSGYLLEGRVARLLESRDFEVQLNCFWQDPRDQKQSIEIDVLGCCSEVIDTQDMSMVFADLVIECKNNSQPVAFFLQPQLRATSAHRIKYAGYPVSSADPETLRHVYLHDLLGMKDWHHYFQTREVATQVCTFFRNTAVEEQKRKEKRLQGDRHLSREDWSWRAGPNESYSRSFAALCAAVAGYAEDFPVASQNIDVAFYYPIIVFQGPIYAVRVKGTELDIEPTDHVQLLLSTSISGRIVEAQGDVVSEQGFPSLVDTILAELRQVASGVKTHYERLLTSAIDQKQAAYDAAVLKSLYPSFGQGDRD
ncbi:MAG TPA: hypothetical protein VN345_16270, partial [Blastocatellia bacterium]|nr:hypothetical protein [Blastocatellia bacterium]